MKRIVKHTFYLLLLFLLVSCNNDDEQQQPDGPYSSGAFIVNEGNFGGSNGDLTFYDEERDTLVQNIFRATNTFFPGDVLQYVYFEKEEAFLVLNGSNKLEIVDRNDFKSTNTLQDETQIINPRAIGIWDQFGFITNWGDFDENFALNNSWVSVLNVGTKEIENKIPVPAGPEGVHVTFNRAFIACGNFGQGNTLAVISLTTLEREDDIEVPAGPHYLKEDVGGNLWLLCKGTFGNNNGALVKINPVTKEKESTLPLGINPGNMFDFAPDGRLMYYYTGNQLFAFDTRTDNIPGTAFITTEGGISGVGVHPENGDIYISFAGDFQSQGVVRVYDADGDFKKEIQSGIGPQKVIFQ